MKKIIEIQNPIKPQNEDILVYNEKLVAYEQIRKSHFLREVNAQIIKLQSQIDELRNENQKLKKDISLLAKTIKENIK